MKIIFIIIVLVTTTVQAFRLRENSNVLVPNNDVNVHANIKKLLREDDFDPNEVNEFIKIKKLQKSELPNEISLQPLLPNKSVYEGKYLNSNEDFNYDHIDDILDPSMIKTDTKWMTTISKQSKEILNYAWDPEPDEESDNNNNHNNNNKNNNNNNNNKFLETTINLNNFTPQFNFTTLTTVGLNFTIPATTEDFLRNLTNTEKPTTPHFNFSTPSLNFTFFTTPTNEILQNSTNFETSSSQYVNFSTPILNFTTITSSDNFTFTVTPQSTYTTFDTTKVSAIFTTPKISTTTIAEPNPTANEECLLGKISETLKWVDENGELQMNYIRNSREMKEFRCADYSRKKFNIDYFQIQVVEVLSLAYNCFDDLPYELINQSSHSLQYFSLVGNNFQNLSIHDTLNLPNLEELDLRNCGITEIKSALFRNLNSLKRLYLSENNIIALHDDSFIIPVLEHLDLSSNWDSPNQSPLILSHNVFTALRKLKFLDLSHTKLDTKSINALSNLPKDLIGVSFCYTELATGNNFLARLTNIKYLDLSGNPQMNFTKTMFSNISDTLVRLEVKDANVRSLEWTHPLTKLKVLNLKDNKLKYVDNNSFSHMLDLEDLNLSKNSIVNWYSPLFAQNQELKTLNLRENALTNITSDMREDLLKVSQLALGKNAFECSCVLYEFMHSLFEATKNANLTEVAENLGIPSRQSTIQSVSMGVRNVLRPEYDIMLRTYEKYYEQVLKSIDALKKNNYNRKSKSLMSVMMSMDETLRPKPTLTVLLDYDENNEDYQCINVTEKELQSMLKLVELCDVLESREPPYESKKIDIIIALSASIPSVLCVSVLLFIIYWKWWYIRYFFVLCKNSAILSFMDDDNGGKEAIVRKQSTNSIEIFLYDVFVSYSDQNRNWVLDEFIPNIERRESINVCLHERDFQVGYGILENIVSCMDRSRCLLLLVSEQFLQSQWCQFEMNLAQHRLLETRKEKLILVLLEDIPVRKQTKTLKYLMRTKTYIKWPNNGTNEEKQMFWKRLKKSIISSKWEHDNFGSSNA